MTETKILVNISNHPSTKWSDEQKAQYCEIIDVPFLNIDPRWDAVDISKEAQKFLYAITNSIRTHFDERDLPVYLKNQIEYFVAGEFSFAYVLTNHLRSLGNTVVTATTERKSVETVKADGTVEKTVIFQFVQWREVK